MTEIRINGKKYDFFNDLTLNLTFDSIASSFQINAYYDPNNKVHRSLFKPLSYQNIQFYEDGQLLLTGYCVSQNMGASDTNQLVAISGYSKSGVLNDCTVGQANYPLQFDGKTLVEITETLIAPFGLSLVVDSSVSAEANKVYTQDTIGAEESISNYLGSLCAQRNIILSHNSSGNVFFTSALSNQKSIATYREEQPTTTISLSTNGQRIHSEVAVLKQATIGSDIESDGVVNNSIVNRYRPLVKEQTKGDTEDSESTAKRIRGEELKAITITVSSDRWIWYDGRVVSLIKPNNYIDVIAPNIYLPNRTNLFVNSVTLTENANSRKATLNCVVPESFNGNEPKDIFR